MGVTLGILIIKSEGKLARIDAVCAVFQFNFERGGYSTWVSEVDGFFLCDFFDFNDEFFLKGVFLEALIHQTSADFGKFESLLDLVHCC